MNGTTTTDYAPPAEQVWWALRNLFPNHELVAASLTLRSKEGRFNLVGYDYPTSQPSLAAMSSADSR